MVWTLRAAPQAQRAETRTADFFPMAVWYGGGKVRAPMLERNARSKKETWRKDVQQIKGLGFNTVRAWIDWASGEPAPGKYDFETLDVLLELAQEEGLKLDPGVRAADNAFYSALAQRARKSPAFIGWDLWSEPHVINWANPTWIPNPEFCFC